VQYALGPLFLVCATVLSACQSLEGGKIAVGTTAEEPFVATDEPARLGREQFDRANYGLAEKYFRSAVEATPLDADAWVGLAASYDQLRRFDLADRAYDQALKLKGPTVPILNNLGFSYLLRGNAAEAERYFAQARAQDPNNPVVRNNLKILRSGPST
jgi:Flp pilus assembly protein TadD